MRIFKGHLNSLTLLSCCASPKDQPSPTTPGRQPVIENCQPRPIQAPVITQEARGRSKTREREGAQSLISSSPSPRSSSRTRSSVISSSRSSCSSPISTKFNHVEQVSHGETHNVFQPLCLRFSNPGETWSSDISRLYSDRSARYSPQETQASSREKSSSSLDNTRKPSKLSTHNPNYPTIPKGSEITLSKPSRPRLSLHMRALSEPTIQQRIKQALNERTKLIQTLDELETDIKRKSHYLNSRPSSRASSRASRKDMYPHAFGHLPPHPLKSAPTHPFTRPTGRPTGRPNGRSLSLTSRNPRPDRGTFLPPLPPLPLILQPPVHTKEKSISRVSNWLTNTGQNGLIRSPSSVTNVPRPVTIRDGFYKCVELSQLSMETATSVSHCYSEQPTTGTSFGSNPLILSDELNKNNNQFGKSSTISNSMDKNLIGQIIPGEFRESGFGIAI